MGPVSSSLAQQAEGEPRLHLQIGGRWESNGDWRGGQNGSASGKSQAAQVSWQWLNHESTELELGLHWKTFDFDLKGGGRGYSSWLQKGEAFGASFDFRRSFGGAWSGLARGGAGAGRQKGAPLDEAWTAHGGLGLQWQLREDKRIGLLAVLQSRPSADPVLYPRLHFHWSVADDWFLRDDPNFASGLRLVYRRDPQWDLYLFSGWQYQAFALDPPKRRQPQAAWVHGGAAGIGADWRPHRNWILSGQLGLQLAQEYQFLQGFGNDVDRREVGTAPFFAFQLGFLW